MPLRIVLLVVIMLGFSVRAESFEFDERSDFYAEKPATVECVLEAAHRQGAPANVLLALASIESGKNGAAVKNKNGTFDLGHFQINSVHWEKGGLFEGNPRITKEFVRLRGCFNAELAAWLLKRNLDSNLDQDFWTRAANYHNRKPQYNQIYKSKLIPLAVSWGNWLKTSYPSTSVTVR